MAVVEEVILEPLVVERKVVQEQMVPLVEVAVVVQDYQQVMLVVFKTQFPTSAATWFIVALVVFMAASIQFYARWRRLRAEASAKA